MNRLAFVLCLPLVLACQPGVLDDTGFDLWCGKSLCNWKTEQGSIRRVPTWNAEDYGVELVGKPAVISQMAHQSQTGGPCLRFSVLGNVETEAEVQLELDFSDDGIVDYNEAIPGIRWNRLDILVKLPDQPYSSLKVALDKRGSGTAVFASLAADSVEKCEGDPVVLSGLPLGDWCSRNADCDSGLCKAVGQPELPGVTPQATCGQCLLSDDCGDGLVCGITTATNPSWPPFLGCIPAQSTEDGNICWSDDQCVHSHCLDGVCGECAGDQDCAADFACGNANVFQTGAHYACVPAGSLTNGALCSSARVCASGKCCPAGLCCE